MLSNSAGGYLGLLDANNTALPTAGSFGIDDDAAVPNRLDKAYPLVWEAMQEDDPMMVRQTVLGRVRSLLVVPIWLQSRAMGAVVLFRADVSPYTMQQMNLATGVVSRGAVAIENGRLYAAVQAANTAKSEFVSTVAHELRNPMSNIVGYANLVQQADNIHHNLVGRQREFVNNIERVVGHMDRLVGDLTDISQIETGHLAMEETRVRVDEVAREIREDTRLQIEEREQTYVEDIADDLPDLYADPVRLAQVLTNLVSNAYKYTKPGGTITLRARQDGDWVAFTVADTGIGLTDEQQAMLGTKFWRANNEYTRRQRGTGLGFTITQHLVALMGSEIQVESEVDEGSAFTFRVPVFDGDDDPESTQILPRLQLDDN